MITVAFISLLCHKKNDSIVELVEYSLGPSLTALILVASHVGFIFSTYLCLCSSEELSLVIW